MNIIVVSQMLPDLVTIIFVNKYSLTKISYYYRQYTVTTKTTDRKIQLLYWAESWREKLEAPPTLTLQKSSHISRKNSFFFSLLIRNNYVTYLLLMYSTSPLANRHDICPKKITLPGFWNARITIFSGKFTQPAKILVSTVPKNFMQNKLWFLFDCSKMRLEIYFSSHHLHQWYGSFLTAPFVWFKQTFLPKTLLVWCNNK